MPANPGVIGAEPLIAALGYMFRSFCMKTGAADTAAHPPF